MRFPKQLSQRRPERSKTELNSTASYLTNGLIIASNDCNWPKIPFTIYSVLS